MNFSAAAAVIKEVVTYVKLATQMPCVYALGKVGMDRC